MEILSCTRCGPRLRLAVCRRQSHVYNERWFRHPYMPPALNDTGPRFEGRRYPCGRRGLSHGDVGCAAQGILLAAGMAWLSDL